MLFTTMRQDFDSSEDEGYDRFETQKEFEELDWEDLKKMIPDLVLKRQTVRGSLR